MYIDTINQSLPVSDDAGLDTFDPRLSDITMAIQGGDFSGACTQVQDVYAEGKFDIRLVGYLAFGDFLESGLMAFPEIVEALNRMLGENWDAFGPIKSKEKHAKAMFNWLLKNLLRQLERTQSEGGDNWVTWSNECSAAMMEQVVDITNNIGAAIPERLTDQASGLDEILAKFRAWLTAFYQMQANAEAAAAPEPEPEPEVVEEGEEQAEGQAAPAQGGLALQGSYPLRALIAKMDAFGELSGRGDFARAAIVSMDIQEVLANFDPTLYFPELFSEYKMQMALHISDLMTYASSQDTPEWQAMEAYYKVDLGGFLKM